MAVHFPTEPRPFAAIERKFVDDFAGVARNQAVGMAFVTNQRLSESERDELHNAVFGQVDIFHVDRVAAILDRVGMEHVRGRFLTLPVAEATPPRNMREVFEGPERRCVPRAPQLALRREAHARGRHAPSPRP